MSTLSALRNRHTQEIKDAIRQAAQPIIDAIGALDVDARWEIMRHVKEAFCDCWSARRGKCVNCDRTDR